MTTNDYYETAYSMCATAIRDILEELVSTTTWPVHSHAVTSVRRRTR